MEEDWIDVSKKADEELREALRKENVPEDELDEELKKLKKNAETNIHVRAILITPEMDSVFRKVFEFVIMGGKCKVTKDELRKLEELLWP